MKLLKDIVFRHVLLPFVVAFGRTIVQLDNGRAILVLSTCVKVTRKKLKEIRWNLMDDIFSRRIGCLIVGGCSDLLGTCPEAVHEETEGVLKLLRNLSTLIIQHTAVTRTANNAIFRMIRKERFDLRILLLEERETDLGAQKRRCSRATVVGLLLPYLIEQRNVKLK